MIVKRNFDLRKVFASIRSEMVTAIAFSSVAGFMHLYGPWRPALPFSVAGILGSAVAIFIAFRNQSSYARWWEARTIWGGIVNNSRIFARQIIANADQAALNGKVSQESADQYKKEMIDRQIAFAHSLRLHLRRQRDDEALLALISEDEMHALVQKQNPPNFLLQRQGIRVRQGIQSEILGAFDNISIEPNLAAFSNWQGACERIRNTPLPMNYQYFTKCFLYVFIVLLPFCLAGDLARSGNVAWILPLASLISFVFAVMNKVGEINEDPFENRTSDIPMTAICNTIARDLKEMLGEPLPEQLRPENGYLF